MCVYFNYTLFLFYWMSCFIFIKLPAIPAVFQWTVHRKYKKKYTEIIICPVPGESQLAEVGVLTISAPRAFSVATFSLDIFSGITIMHLDIPVFRYIGKEFQIGRKVFKYRNKIKENEKHFIFKLNFTYFVFSPSDWPF